MALEKVADGVWLLRGDFRGAMNIYFLEDGDGVVQFDAGTKAMRKKAKAAAEELGGLKRVVLEGDEVAGFKVIHCPGHAPGLIGLWRESDRVAIGSDVVYLGDSARLKPLPAGEASVPHPAWAWDHSKA